MIACSAEILTVPRPGVSDGHLGNRFSNIFGEYWYFFCRTRSILTEVGSLLHLLLGPFGEWRSMLEIKSYPDPLSTGKLIFRGCNTWEVAGGCVGEAPPVIALIR